MLLLSAAAFRGYNQEVLRQLEQEKVDVNARFGTSKLPALYDAVMSGHPETVQILLDHGADIYLLPLDPKHEYQTVLCYAVGQAIHSPSNQENYYKIINILLNHEYKIRAEEPEKYQNELPLMERTVTGNPMCNPALYAQYVNQESYQRLLQIDREAKAKYMPAAAFEEQVSQQEKVNDLMVDNSGKTRHFVAKLYSRLKGLPYKLTHFSPPPELEPLLPDASDVTNPASKKNYLSHPRF